MKDFVIESLNANHGKEIVEFYKSIGFDANNCTGIRNREDSDCFIYYGKLLGRFSNYPLSDVESSRTRILTLEEARNEYANNKEDKYFTEDLYTTEDFLERKIALRWDTPDDIDKINRFLKSIDNEYSKIQGFWRYYMFVKFTDGMAKITGADDPKSTFKEGIKIAHINQIKWEDINMEKEINGFNEGYQEISREALGAIYNDLSVCNKWQRKIEEVLNLPLNRFSNIIMVPYRFIEQAINESSKDEHFNILKNNFKIDLFASDKLKDGEIMKISAGGFVGQHILKLSDKLILVENTEIIWDESTQPFMGEKIKKGTEFKIIAK